MQTLLMRRSLIEPVAVPHWPDGVRLETFCEMCASEAHALLTLTYANGGGSVAPFGEWWKYLSGDEEYDPSLCFPAYERGGRLIGFAQCWTRAFVKDLVVRPSHQQRGVGRALMLHAFGIFAGRGAKTVALKVQGDNSVAIRFYESLGMSRVSI
ncbi:MAG: GNAT family N-acetyltransferase [Steroidobacteraceae bacterium]|jgi:ribosomal protein S18 acetylase RimI-like enzyme